MAKTYDDWVETKYGIVDVRERGKRVRKIQERKLKKRSKSWKSSRETQHREKK